MSHLCFWEIIQLFTHTTFQGPISELTPYFNISKYSSPFSTFELNLIFISSTDPFAPLFANFMECLTSEVDYVAYISLENKPVSIYAYETKMVQDVIEDKW